MKSRKLFVSVLMVSLMLIVALLAACGSNPATPAAAAKYGNVTSVKLSGASIGSQTYLFASMIASHWTADLGIPASALIMSESEAIKKFPTKEVEFSYAQVPMGYDSYHGVGTWKDKGVTNYRAVVNMTPYQCYYFAVRGDSNIKTIPDLLNKRIGRAEVGMAVEVYPRVIMEIGYGITEDKVKAAGGVVLHMSYDDMRDKLADGSIDVLSVQVPREVKSPFVLPVEQKQGVRLLPVDKAAADKILAAYPGLSYSSIKGGLYKLEPNDVPAIAVTAIWAARQDLPDQLVYDMLDSMVKSKADYQKNLVNFPDFGNSDVMLRGIKETGVPMHPGAVKWYQDHSITVPKDLLPTS